MIIRHTKLSDIPELSRLIRSIIDTTPFYSPKARSEEKKKHNRSELKHYLKDKKYYTCFVATINNKPIGFAIGRNEAGVFWADWVGVSKEARQKGIAESLMKRWERYLKQKGVHKIWCDTRTSNYKSVSLLQKLNYKKLGTFKNGWYKQDFFLWEKNLI